MEIGCTFATRRGTPVIYADLSFEVQIAALNQSLEIDSGKLFWASFNLLSAPSSLEKLNRENFTATVLVSGKTYSYNDFT